MKGGLAEGREHLLCLLRAGPPCVRPRGSGRHLRLRPLLGRDVMMQKVRVVVRGA
jgi:hypothetical protein